MSDSFETVRLLLKHAPSEVLTVKNSEGRDPEELAKSLSATEFGGLFSGNALLIRDPMLFVFHNFPRIRFQNEAKSGEQSQHSHS